MKAYYLFRAASWLSKYVPSRLAYWLCSLIGGLAFYFAPSVRSATLDNMRHITPNASKSTLRKLARAVVRNAVKNYYDVVRLPHQQPEDIRRTVILRGTEHLYNARDAGHGMILMSGHLGNFNIIAQMAVLLGFQVALIVEDISPPKLYEFVNKLRGRFGIKLIKTGSSGARTIFRLVRDNGMLMLMTDRDVKGDGEPVLLFGAKTTLPVGPVTLAMRLNAPIIPAHGIRQRDNTSLVDIYPPLKLQCTGDNAQDIEANHRLMAQTLEDMIRKSPDQWTVLQRVWDS